MLMERGGAVVSTLGLWLGSGDPDPERGHWDNNEKETRKNVQYQNSWDDE
jgi:hypothetical protein